jgi:hypothetical protein
MSCLSVYMMLPNVVIMDFTGLNLKYFAYFAKDSQSADLRLLIRSATFSKYLWKYEVAC